MDLAIVSDDSDEIPVTSTNAEFLSWSEYVNVTFSGCLAPIPPEKLNNCKETLTTISFWDHVLFPNVQACLQHLPNLKNLMFLQINIHESTSIHERLNINDVIESPNVKSLMVSRGPKLLKDDYFLMDFLTRGVAFGNLEKFTFRGEDAFSFTTPSQDLLSLAQGGNSVNDILGNPSNIESSILSKFLIRNRLSLKTVEICGPGTILFESLTDDIQDLSLVQVDNFQFSMDNEGSNFVLSQQNQLRSLICSEYVYDFSLEKITNISTCIQNNFSTLNFIQIFPNIVYDAEVSENLLSTTTLDCRAFENCLNLQKLQLNLELINRQKDWQSTKSGRVNNIQTIPHSLRHVGIVAERFHDEELHLLANQFGDFEQLEFICLESINPNTFPFKLAWIERLYSLPRLKRILLNGARMDDVTGIMNFISSRPDARGSIINDQELSIFMRNR